jgi:Antitoxin VbhA
MDDTKTTAQITDKAKPIITADEIARRREALRQADANNRLEGIVREPATDEIFEAHIRGEITSAELTARLKALPHPC